MLDVSSLMQRKPKTVRTDMTLTDLERLFLKTGFSGFPVVDEEDRLLGVVSRSDIVRTILVERCRAEQLSDFYRSTELDQEESVEESLAATAAQVGIRLGGLHVEDAMVRTVVSVGLREPARRLAQLMLDGSFHRLPVVDGDRLVGMVTSMDLVQAIAEGRLSDEPNASATQKRLA